MLKDPEQWEWDYEGACKLVWRFPQFGDVVALSLKAIMNEWRVVVAFEIEMDRNPRPESSVRRSLNTTPLISGIMFYELSQNFKLFQNGKDPYKLRFYVAHDGSMIRLASGLGLGKSAPLRWPAMGSEFVMEVSISIPLMHPQGTQFSSRCGVLENSKTSYV